MNFALDKQIERLIEVLALSALLKEETVIPKKTIYKLKLKEFVYPEEINLEWFVKTVKKIFQYAIQFTQASKGVAFLVW